MAELLHTMVCIVGAGPVGGTLACRLAMAGVATVIVDRAPLSPMEHPAFDGRAYAIAAGLRRLLEAAGLWDKLPQPTCPICDIRVTDGRVGRPASPPHLHFATRDLGAEAGPFGWMVEARSLRVAVNAHMAALSALRVFAPARADVERRPDGVVVRVAGGPDIVCRLVIAAEGRGSALREAAGIPVTRLPYGQTGIVCAVAHERPHHNVALEHFLPSGPFAQLPMCAAADAPHVSAIVWTERERLARIILGLDDGRFAREVGRRLGDHLGAVRLDRAPLELSPGGYADRASLHRHAAGAGGRRAAHGIHPIAGQGLNLGFRDVEVLAGLVIDAAAARASTQVRQQRCWRATNGNAARTTWRCWQPPTRWTACSATTAG